MKGKVITSMILILFFLLGGFLLFGLWKLNNEVKTVSEEASSLRNEVGELISEINELKEDKNSTMEQTEEVEEILGESESMIDKEKVCREAEDLLLEIKQNCDVKPFPGIDECIAEIESKKDYLGEEDFIKYHMDEKLSRLKELKSQYLPLKTQCEE